MNRNSSRSFDLEDRLIEFAVSVCNIAENLPKTLLGKHVSGQLLRSGTAPAPNYGEAQGAESRKDFIHKMRLCLKELRETKVWLRFVQRKELLSSSDIEKILKESNELIAIFVTSINTAEQKNNAKKELS